MAESKIILITGANTGIGLATIESLLCSSQKYHILLSGRSIEKAQLATRNLTSDNRSQSSIEAFELDVENDESIQKAYKEIAAKHPRIDCLVNNAGASFDQQIQQGNMSPREAWNRSWDVNVTGAHVMTLTFLPLLLRSQDPRLLFLTSGVSSLHESSETSNPCNRIPPAGLPKDQMFVGYRSAKTGLNMMMVQWARLLKNDGVKVWAVAPGLLATSLGGCTKLLKNIGAKEPRIGGNVVCGVIEGKRDADVGSVVREYRSPIQPW